MKNFLPVVLVCFLASACRKEGASPGNTSTGTGALTGAGVATKSSAISVLINNQPMLVTLINYNRSSGSFNFTAQNDLQKVDASCFYFYQQSWASYMYSDSINYSTRADTLSGWYTRRAQAYGEVYFDCCTAPLNGPEITGNYKGNFSLGKDSLVITGNFDLLFK